MKRIKLLFLLITAVTLPVFSQDPPKSDAGTGGGRGRFTVSEAGPPIDGKFVTGGVLNGKAISLPKPAYPSSARAVRASGAVSVQVLIGEDGSILSASAVTGHLLLRAAAVAAAKQAKFSPTLLEGRPVKVSGIITYNFVGATSVEQTVLGIGYDLTEGEISRSLYPGQVKTEIPSNWTEERALLEKIAESIKKYAIENPPKIEISKIPPAENSMTLQGSPRATAISPDRRAEVNSGEGFTVMSIAPGSATTVNGLAAGKFGEDGVAYLIELQVLINGRFAENQPASWYFRYGQTLARLKNFPGTDGRFAAAINELQGLAADMPAGATESLRASLNELLVIAEGVRLDPGKKTELDSRILILQKR
jgi:TonB family protein